MSAERDRVETFGRLEDGLRQAGDWYLWGPYLSERQWGTVREDYSPGGTAWDYLPHDHARSRAYRWGEDGLAGFSDVEQRLCLGLALWNGRDPILKERIFGLTGERGQPRRGCEGVLVVPRRPAEPRLEPLALPLPAGASFRTPISWPRTGGGASSTPSTSCSTRASSTTTATGSSRPTTPRATHTTSCSRCASRMPGPRPTRCMSSRPPGTGTPGPGGSTERRSPSFGSTARRAS